MSTDNDPKVLHTYTDVDAEDLFEAFVDAPYGVYCVNLEGSIVFCNQTAAQILDTTEVDLIGKSCSEIIGPPLNRTTVSSQFGCEAILPALSGDIAPSSDFSITTPLGSQKWLSVTHMLLPSEKPSQSLIAHILYDMTDQVEGKMLLQRLGSYLSSLGSIPTPAVVPRRDSQTVDKQTLTNREMEVLRLLSQGTSTKEIATTLVIGEATVRTHIQHILDKTGTKSRLEAVTAASRLGII